MKQITKISIILFAILFTCCEASCTNKVPKSKKKIKKVAYMYLDAMANYRIDNAVPFCTKETREGVIETGRALLQSVDTNYIKSDHSHRSFPQVHTPQRTQRTSRPGETQREMESSHRLEQT